MVFRTLSLAALLLAGTPAFAQLSAPQPTPPVDTVPAARDVDYPGTLTLDVDATDIARGILRAKQTIPVAKSGHMVLLYPKWLPGKHGPRGEVEKLAGLEISAGGKRLAWRRDPLDMFAFHIDVPAGARRLDVELAFLAPTVSDQGRMIVTPNMMSLQFNSLSLYPAGYFTRRIPIIAKVKYPEGWSAASALNARVTGSTYAYEKTSYEVLVDSPVLAGRHYRSFELTPKVSLDVFADKAEELAATPEQIAAHRRVVEQAVKLVGSEPYDHYRFLFSISDDLGGIGLEHHRSTEIGRGLGHFLKWDDVPTGRNVFPHEFFHSWDGKYRRPADLWTPDFRMPMRGSLLWVYEGQTQFWGYVLQARSGLVSKDVTLDSYAGIAATLDNRRAREWRPMGDTTLDPVISARAPKGWVSYQRSEDYYNEGLLIWMEVDSILREQSRGARSIDDFARAFFHGRDGDYGQVTYTFDDVVRTLEGVQPYDWRKLLNDRVNGVSERAPLGGFERNGYRLIYNDVPNKATPKGTAEFAYSLGLTITAKGISQVMWGSPAFDAGITLADTIVSVNGTAYSSDVLKDAVAAAKGGKAPIRLMVKRDENYREVALDYHGGLRYPHLEKSASGEAGLDKLLQPR